MRESGREDLSRNEILKCRNAKRWKRAGVSENETAQGREKKRKRRKESRRERKRKKKQNEQDGR